MTTLTTTFFGVNPDETPIEQPISAHWSADGLLVITRRWIGTHSSITSLQTPIRTPLGALSTIQESILPDLEQTDFLCVESDIDPIAGKPDLYLLTETYQGAINTPFTIYSWTTARVDIPITQHPNFNTTPAGEAGIMLEGVNWQLAGTPLTFTSFPVFNIGGTTPNPYVGITDFPGVTGIWKKVSYYVVPGNSDGSPGTTGLPQYTGKLWKSDVPDFGPYKTTMNLPDTDNTGEDLEDGYITWIKSQEDFENSYRGASSIWTATEAWYANVSRGWRKDIYEY